MSLSNHAYRKSVDTIASEKVTDEGHVMAKWLRDYFTDKEDKFQLYELRHYWGIKSIKSNLSIQTVLNL